MRLSALQKYILTTCFSARGKVGRALLHKFYEGKNIQHKVVVNVVTKTLERLIDKGLLVGLGVRTPKKWYIKEVRLTQAGRKAARQLQGKQLRLPLQ